MIYKLLKEQAITAKEAAMATGIAQSSFTDWKKGRSNPSYGALVKLADYFGVSVEYLEGKTDIMNSVPKPKYSDEALKIAAWWDRLDERGKAIIKGEILKRVEWLERVKARGGDETTGEPAPIPTATTQIPMLGRAAAGTPIEMIVTYDAFDINADTATRPGDFAVQAVGDSMIDAGIRDGDLCIIRPQPTVENGEIALVAVDDGSTIKRFYNDNGTVRLVPCNPAHRSQLYDAHTEIRVLGKFIRTV